ncbi:MAG TPA: glycoside hydrolase family 3 N-terminal domain-containing protein [Candidatus Acidoferrales bacterium]|nr:glycoside hydrolase family 3 N-terminal domain-containing protein [Candidatus Acidoferrales bacterium]
MSHSTKRAYKIVFAALCCIAPVLPVVAGGDQPATVDSQTFLQRNMTPAGPPASEFSAKVEQLLRKMTLKEKIGQMTQLEIGMVTDGADQDIQIDPAKLHKAVVEYGVGSILNVNLQALPAQKWQELIRAIQNEAQRTRLKIPVLYGLDSIHGANYVLGATLFPQPLGMAATWNPELMLQDSRISAAETRKAGVPWVFSPVLDVGRQPLWPRLYETFGEDTYLATVMGIATVRGFEGTDLSSDTSVAASLKHYVGYSDPTNGGDRSPALIPERDLRDYYLPSFAAAVRAGAHSVMVNSSEVNGIPGHANKYLLTNVLRDELGFRGFVVSDWGDIKNLVLVHHVAPTEKDATQIAVLAGIDMSMVPSSYSFSDLLFQLAQEGKVPMSRVDEAVRNILTVKYQLGLFDDPMRGVNAPTVIGSPSSRRVSLQAARESITLLKNEEHVLPLSKGTRVLVTGPDADSLIPLDNGWSYTWQGSVASLYPKDEPTILGAIQEKIGLANVAYVPGTTFDKEIDIDGAAKAAANFDAIVACIGEWSYAETPGNIGDLALPGAQLALVRKLEATNKPVILVLTEGRPRIIRTIAGGARGILMAYNPGNEGGQAIADILFGDVNPSGKLPVTYPRWPNRLFTYDHKYFLGQDAPEGKVLATPEFEFGYGLSYTTFSYSDLRVSPSTASGRQTIRVSVNVRNTGPREGREVVELYLSKRFASVTPPLKRLKRFAKIDLQPGQEQRVSFVLAPYDLSFIGVDNKRVIEPGAFDVHVGGLTQSFEWQ